MGLLLGKYHRKHRFTRAMRPRIHDIMKYVGDFCNKVQWQWIFRHSESVRPFKVPSHVVGPPCEFDVAPELRCWTSFFTSHLRKACARALSRHYYHPHRWSNRTALDNFSLKWLRDSGYAVVPTDKDGGYCLVPGWYMVNAHQEILNKSWYEEFPIESLPSRVEQDPSFASIITKSLRCGNESGLVRKLDVTVKSHKPRGDVSFRNIHAGGVYPFAGLEAWLSHRLKDRLQNLPHLLKNTDGLVRLLRNLESDVPIKLVKVDIKDYFMSGTPETLIEHGASMLEPKFQQVGSEAIEFLLRHQYVRQSVASASRYWHGAQFLRRFE